MQYPVMYGVVVAGYGDRFHSLQDPPIGHILQSLWRYISSLYSNRDVLKHFPPMGFRHSPVLELGFNYPNLYAIGAYIRDLKRNRFIHGVT